MGAIKENFYTENETNLFYAARAFAHPVRVKMITELFVDQSYRNTDLVKMLKLSKGAIHNHVEKLKDAKMVEISYSMHFYEINLSAKGQVWSDFFIGQREEE